MIFREFWFYILFFAFKYTDEEHVNKNKEWDLLYIVIEVINTKEENDDNR